MVCGVWPRSSHSKSEGAADSGKEMPTMQDRILGAVSAERNDTESARWLVLPRLTWIWQNSARSENPFDVHHLSAEDILIGLPGLPDDFRPLSVAQLRLVQQEMDPRNRTVDQRRHRAIVRKVDILTLADGGKLNDEVV